jgi:hypothetical protein
MKKSFVAATMLLVALTVPASAEYLWKPEPLKGHNIHHAMLGSTGGTHLDCVMRVAGEL